MLKVKQKRTGRTYLIQDALFDAAKHEKLYVVAKVRHEGRKVFEVKETPSVASVASFAEKK